MDRSLEVGPLRIKITDSEIGFEFTDPMAMMLEIPPSFEEQLRDVANDRRADFEGKNIHIDLADLPAISSRQLGMILTVREVMKPFGILRLHNISNSIKHVLRLTGTERLFDLPP